MPITNYCKKCKASTPPGEVCPRCGSRLTKAGERLMLTRSRVAVRDWFCWNARLRVVVPVLLIVPAVAIAAEAAAEGADGVCKMFAQGFWGWVLLTASALLLGTLGVLAVQGKETVRCVLDAKGVHLHTSHTSQFPLGLGLGWLATFSVRLHAQEPTEGMDGGDRQGRQTDLPWAAVRRVRYWPETRTLLFYKPRLWLAIAVRCEQEELFLEAVAYTEKKLARKKGVLRKAPIRRKT